MTQITTKNDFDNTTFMKGWYVITDIASIRKKKPYAIRRFGLDLVIWRNDKNQFNIMLDRCPHRSAQLSGGKINSQGHLTCPFHGFAFNSTGQCQYAPELKQELPGLSVKTFFCQNYGGMLWMYYGPGQPPELQVEDLKTVDKQFKGQFSLTRRIWNSHITRCIENQLDYTHLPIVHHNSIGKNAHIPENPILKTSETTIALFSSQQHADTKGSTPKFRYEAPNRWYLNLPSKKLQLMAYFVPIDQTHTEILLVSYRTFGHWWGIAPLFNKIFNTMNRFILQQDQRVVKTQGTTPSYTANHECLLRHDHAIKAFRTLWQQQLLSKKDHDTMLENE